MRSLLVFFILLPCFLLSQNSKRTFKSIRKIDNRVKIEVSDGVYLVSAYSDKIIECSFIPDGDETNYLSHAVNLFPAKNLKLEIHGFQKVAYIRNGAKFYVRIQFAPFSIRYVYNGKDMLSEGEGFTIDENKFSIALKLQEDEKLYGGGSRVLGMNRRGNKLELYNKAHYGYETHSELMNFCVPMFLSDRLYAVHFDNPEIGYLDLDSKQQNEILFESSGGNKTYQVIVGEDWKDLVSEYTFLTGRQPLPPRWIFGNFASRFGYHSEQEARNVVEQFKIDSIPLDAIVFDLYWFGKEIKGSMGDFEFYRDSFPNGEQMIFDFRKDFIKSVFITEPFILSTSKNWEEAISEGILATDSVGLPYKYDFYFGNTGLIDIFNKKGRKWLWEKYANLIDLGVEGMWGDLGEPEVHPKDIFHYNKTSEQVHNIYGHHWAKLIFEGYQENYPEKRPFILMRSGYSGSQKYGMIPWSGDVNRTWKGLEAQPEISLQMGLQGIAYMHSDLGGFAGANDDSELYTRWLQYGVFQPIFRPHAQEEVPSEPIFKDKSTKQRAKEAIELRYKLLPYNYSLAFENHTTGIPLMRPVFLEDTSEHWTEDRSDCYMWGPSFFIRPISKKNKRKFLYFELPKQSTWFDFYTGKLVRPGTKGINLPNYIAYENTLDRIPVFVKSGSFIPICKNPYLNTSFYNPKDVEVHFYMDEVLENSEGIWYEDDGVSQKSIENGKFQLIKFAYRKLKKFNQIEITNLQMHKSKFVENFDLVMHVGDYPPKKIKINDAKTKFYLDEKEGTIILPVSLKKSNKVRIKLIY